MSEDHKHIDHELPPHLHEVLKGLGKKAELITPVYYFEDLSQRVQDRVNEEAIDSLSDITGLVGSNGVNDLSVNEAFFDQQSALIMSQIRLSHHKNDDNQFKIPESFFENQETHIKKEIFSKKNQTRSFRINLRVLSYAAAAAIVVIGLFVLWPKNSVNENSFATRLDETSLDFEDLEYFADEEEYYDLYFHEMATDTISTDTLGVARDGAEVNEKNETIKLDPKTGLPLQTDQTTGSSETNISWDEISQEDLLEYLMEEGDDELIDEMN